MSETDYGFNSEGNVSTAVSGFPIYTFFWWFDIISNKHSQGRQFWFIHRYEMKNFWLGIQDQLLFMFVSGNSKNAIISSGFQVNVVHFQFTWTYGLAFEMLLSLSWSLILEMHGALQTVQYQKIIAFDLPNWKILKIQSKFEVLVKIPPNTVVP